MSDFTINSGAALPGNVYTPQNDPTKAVNRPAVAQNTGVVAKDIGTVVLSVEKSEAKAKEKETQAQTQEKQDSIETTKRVHFSYDQESGESIVKFIDDNGKIVLQVPSEEYLRIRSMMSKDAEPLISKKA
ncbi:MAG: flagellar protein FlaG [Nitrospirae bacterium]|nr:flagellar protein FlaG [Nitrospirota bacterium]